MWEGVCCLKEGSCDVISSKTDRLMIHEECETRRGKLCQQIMGKGLEIENGEICQAAFNILYISLIWHG